MANSTRVYNDLTAFEAAVGPILRDGGQWLQRSCKSADHDWDLNLGARRAATMLSTGWPEGLEQLKNAAIGFDGDDLDGGTSVYYDEQGYMPNSQIAMSGDPACFMAFESAPQSVPVIRLALSFSAACSVKAQDFVTRGAAYLTLINALEQGGARVEVWLVGSSQSMEDGRDNIDFGIKLKDAGDQLNLNGLAFTTAHPAFLRRHGFAAIEKQVTEDKGGTFCDGYGKPAVTAEDLEKSCNRVFGKDHGIHCLPVYARPLRGQSVEQLVSCMAKSLADAGLIAPHQHEQLEQLLLAA